VQPNMRRDPRYSRPVPREKRLRMDDPHLAAKCPPVVGSFWRILDRGFGCRTKPFPAAILAGAKSNWLVIWTVAPAYRNCARCIFKEQAFPAYTEGLSIMSVR